MAKSSFKQVLKKSDSFSGTENNLDLSTSGSFRPNHDMVFKRVCMDKKKHSTLTTLQRRVTKQWPTLPKWYHIIVA